LFHRSYFEHFFAGSLEIASLDSDVAVFSAYAISLADAPSGRSRSQKLC
jgi:hypothetical protein